MWALVILILLLAFNAFLAMSETSVVASRHGRLEQWADTGNKAASRALELARHPERFLASVQIGVTAIGIVLGAFSESTLSGLVQTWLVDVPSIARYAHTIATTVVIILVTFLTFLVEIVPKRLTLYNPEVTACKISGPMSFLERLLHPLVSLITATVHWFVRVFHPTPAKTVPVTEAELLLLVEQGAKAGVFEEEEQEMLTAVLRLGNMRASAIMTPRTELQWIDIHDTPEQVLKTLKEGHEFEILVADETPDKPVGVLNPREYLALLADGNLQGWKQLIHHPCYVPDNENALDLLRRFRETRTNSALVVNEYGGIDGLVTIRDIVESVVGTLPQGGEHVHQLDKNHRVFSVDGLTSMDEFREAFGLRPPADNQQPEYDTVAGLVLNLLGHIPHVGESVKWQGLKMTVTKMDGYRIDKIRVITKPSPRQAEGDKPAHAA